jgi:hypothetical protein
LIEHQAPQLVVRYLTSEPLTLCGLDYFGGESVVMEVRPAAIADQRHELRLNTAERKPSPGQAQ